jgi:hypothetical protein
VDILLEVQQAFERPSDVTHGSGSSPSLIPCWINVVFKKNHEFDSFLESTSNSDHRMSYELNLFRLLELIYAEITII